MDDSRPRRIGVFGGTFDPIHLGHLVAAREAHHVFELDLLLFVPAARPWQKEAAASAEDRFLMTELAVATHPAFAVSRLELDRPGPTYTADTLEVLRDRFEGSRLFFIAGADALSKLDTWKRFDALAELGEMIAVSRAGHRFEPPEDLSGWPRLHHLAIPSIGISATEIRTRVREGRPFDHMVLPEVASCIRARGLYQDRAARTGHDGGAA